MLTPQASKRICDFYGVGRIDELLKVEQAQLEDAVMDGFCKQCGSHYGRVEPDAEDYCCPECDTESADSLLMIVMSEA